MDVCLDFRIEGIEFCAGIEHGVAQEVDNEAAGTIGRHGSKTYRLLIKSLHLWT